MIHSWNGWFGRESALFLMQVLLRVDRKPKTARATARADIANLLSRRFLLDNDL
jgi:hypothetical protein